jgi:flagellar motor switch protein FliM
MTVLLANGWLRRSAPSALPRWKAETVLAALPLRFVAHLGQANVEVGDLASLDVGDVLLLSQTSKDPMQLLAIDTDLQLNAHLGAHGTHRAAQLMASPRGAAR